MRIRFRRRRDPDAEKSKSETFYCVACGEFHPVRYQQQLFGYHVEQWPVRYPCPNIERASGDQ